MIPEIRDEELEPDIRGDPPEAPGPGVGFRDFVIAEESARGLPVFVDLVGIESPGLTAATAIAERVAESLPTQRGRRARIGGVARGSVFMAVALAGVDLVACGKQGPRPRTARRCRPS